MFKTRLISGIVLVLIALITIIIGKDLLLAVLAVISLIGLREFYSALDIEKTFPAKAGYLMGLLWYVLLRFVPDKGFAPLMAFSFLLLFALYVIRFPEYDFRVVAYAFTGIMYLPVMMSYLYRTRMLPEGSVIVWLAILGSWGCDTCAYCAGMLLGKHKLCPKLSPKKSVEGAVGGVIGAALLGALYGLIMQKAAGIPGDRIWQFAVICAASAVISQFGDLAASGIKRNHDIKDYGTLIPGHGGILDRFDSVIFVSPVIYYLAVLLISA